MQCEKKRRDGGLFVSGGPGYTLNKAALKLLVVDGFRNFFQSDHSSAEDVKVSQTLGHLGVRLYDTRDEQGRERYHFHPPGKMYETFQQPPKRKTWWHKHSIEPIKYGLDHMSPESVSFHYIKTGDDMKRIHALLYDPCPNILKAIT